MRARRPRAEAASPPPAVPERAPSGLALFLVEPTRPSRGARRARATMTGLQESVANAVTRSESGDWSGARGTVFVGLYAHCHNLVHGVLPVELEPAMPFAAACKLAHGLLTSHFPGEPAGMADFVKWAWEIEADPSRLEWARRVGYRLGWRKQFSAALLTTYLAAARTGT